MMKFFWYILRNFSVIYVNHYDSLISRRPPHLEQLISILPVLVVIVFLVVFSVVFIVVFIISIISLILVPANWCIVIGLTIEWFGEPVIEGNTFSHIIADLNMLLVSMAIWPFHFKLIVCFFFASSGEGDYSPVAFLAPELFNEICQNSLRVLASSIFINPWTVLDLSCISAIYL